MKKAAALTALLAVSAYLAGCAQIAMGRSEINKLFITRIICIDQADGGKVRITLATKSLSTGMEEQQQQKEDIIIAEGNTVYDASRNLALYSDRKPHYGHTEYILLGESIARKGILPYLDFISRHSEFRHNAKIYVVKGDSAGSLVEKSKNQKMFIGDRIANIEEMAPLSSLSSIITLNEALIEFDDENLDTFIPCIESIKSMDGEKQQDMYDILLEGYAIFGKDKLFYFTSREESRGLNWMTNRIGSGIILVKTRKGEEVSLVIGGVEVKIKPRIEGSKLKCTIDASFTTNIGEIMGTEIILDNESIRYLTEQQNKVVRKEITKALEAARRDNSDRFGIVTKFILRYPMLREYLRENWSSLFPDIEFDIKVRSNIKGTYLINEPNNAAGEVKGE